MTVKPPDLLIFSDLHLREESRDVCKEVLDAILYNVEEKGINTIAFLGDFWHLRYRVPIHLQNMVKDWIHELYQYDIDLIILPGNHDQINAGDGANAMEVFEGFPNVKVYSEPQKDEFGVWMPYRKHPEQIKEALAPFKKQGYTLFAHLPIAGAMMNNNIMNTDGVPLTILRGFEHVICGHYHKRQSFAGGMAHYVGSPYQTRADEHGQKKGWCYWYQENSVLGYVDRIFGKRYHRLDLVGAGKGDLTSIDWSRIKPGDQLKVVVTYVDDVEPMKEKLSVYIKNSKVKILVEPEQTAVVGPRHGLTKGTTLFEYAQAYTKEHSGPKMHPKDLLDVFEEIRDG